MQAEGKASARPHGGDLQWPDMGLSEEGGLSLLGRPEASFGLGVRWEAREDSEQEPAFQRPWLVWAACGCWCVWKSEGYSDSPG